MKPAVCRLCGAAHWTHEPHVTAGVVPRAVARELGRDEKPVTPRRVAATVRDAGVTVRDATVTAVCGHEVPRPKHCSQACRQKAYRKRTP